MSDPIPAADPCRALRRAAYALGQSARVGLYFGQYRLSQRLTTPLPATRAAALAFHEPYYADYLRHDLVAAAAQAGLRRREADCAYFAKLLVFERPTP